MSAIHTHEAWTNTRVKGNHKLALLAVAANANHKGEAHVSVRHIAAMVGVSKTRANDLIADLIQWDFLRVVSTGGGKGNPNTYWITPQRNADMRPHVEPPEVKVDTNRTSPREYPFPETLVNKDVPAGSYQFDPEPDTRPQITDVQAVLNAAGVKPAPDQPFYWQRSEHKDDLAEVLERLNLNISAFCTAIHAGVASGKSLEHQPRRIRDFVLLVGA